MRIEDDMIWGPRWRTQFAPREFRDRLKKINELAWTVSLSLLLFLFLLLLLLFLSGLGNNEETFRFTRNEPGGKGLFRWSGTKSYTGNRTGTRNIPLVPIIDDKDNDDEDDDDEDNDNDDNDDDDDDDDDDNDDDDDDAW